MFWCPGCDGAHLVYVGDGQGPRWGYNGNPDAPTFTPSVLVRNGHYMPEHTSPECWCTYNEKHPEQGGKYKSQSRPGCA